MMSDEIAKAAAQAVDELTADRTKALDLLEGFCERFYWIKDHPDYQTHVREFLIARGRNPAPLG
jgi:hypothetical protein